MGLDMYLTAEKYQWGAFDEEPTPITQAVNTVCDTKGHQVSTIRINACDWRKANEIHAWFVENVQGGEDECQRHVVAMDRLKELVSLCKDVLANKDKAKELLPTQAGFFFGSTDYDEYYFEDLQDTIDKLTPFITDPYWEKWDFYYQSSW